ncbi:MAG: hypothetical protein Q9225_006878, partial [Loekoesia sp. 1 TL-2023]
MEPVSFHLSNNAVVTGLRTPPLPSPLLAGTPLIVGLHGGSYSAHYYDATPSHSALPHSTFLRVPFISLNRPGYLDSTALPTPLPEGSTWPQEEGKYLHREILPAIWKTYSRELGVSGIIIIGHSLSVPMTIVAAALNAVEQEKSYPLAGIIVSGFGTSINVETQSLIAPHFDRSSNCIRFPTQLKDDIMLCGLADPEVLAVTESLNTSVGIPEFADAAGEWLSHWRERYAKDVKCP